MAAPKREGIQREQDLPVIAEMYCQGLSMREVADKLAAMRNYRLSVQSIKRDIDAIITRWRDEATASVSDAKARELLKLSHLEAQAWRGWERSNGEAMKTLCEDVTDTQGGRQRRQVTKETKPDPRYLAIVRDVIAQRCKILHLDNDLVSRIEQLERRLAT